MDGWMDGWMDGLPASQLHVNKTASYKPTSLSGVGNTYPAVQGFYTIPSTRSKLILLSGNLTPV